MALQRKSTLLLTLLGLTAGQCPGGCSGRNGHCGANAKCWCKSGFQGPDCSLRQCPFTIAWADTADGTNQAHYYAECGNKGTCDRTTGDCKCFEGYVGSGCRRMDCPNSCSGRGTCEYMSEIAGDFSDRRSGPGSRYQDITCQSQASGAYNTGTTRCAANLPEKNMKVVSGANFFSEQRHGFIYNKWDAKKIQVCKCDLGYKGSDCSIREVPRGDDPLTVVKSESMKQNIKISGHTGGEFFLQYHDPYGGSWRTDTIRAVGTGTATDDEVVALKVQTQLRSLPNNVLEDVVVTAISTGTNHPTCHRFDEGTQHYSPHDITRAGSSINSKQRPNWCEVSATTAMTGTDTSIDLMVDFGIKPGRSGVQNYLEVDISQHGAGSFPVSTGLTGTSVAVSVAEINYNDNLGNLSELSPCSDRGLDNGDGECECFDGFGGLACEEQTSLV